MHRTVFALLLAIVCSSAAARAQSGAGGLTGFVKDEQGGVLPGVTVTATGPELLTPAVGVTDSAGYYRLQNLPPGTVTLTAELTGFATFRREGILMRAGSSFTVDIDLKVGALSETVTVSGESPMVSTGLPTKTMTVDGDLLRAAPISARRAFSDVLDMAPGVNSRNSDGASGRIFNLETTSGAHVTRDEWYRSNLPMTDAALRNGLYMRPLSRRRWAPRTASAYRH